MFTIGLLRGGIALFNWLDAHRERRVIVRWFTGTSLLLVVNMVVACHGATSPATHSAHAQGGGAGNVASRASAQPVPLSHKPAPHVVSTPQRTWPGSAKGIALSPNGQLLAAGGDSSTIRIWSLDTGRLVRSLRVPNGGGGSLAFGRHGRKLFSADGSQYGSGPVYVWRVSSGRLLGRIATSGSVLALSPDGDTLAVDYLNHGKLGVNLFSASDGRFLRRLPETQIVDSLAFSPDGQVLATGGEDGIVRIWSTATGRLSHTLKHGGSIVAIAFSPNGRILASGGNQTKVQLWDWARAKRLRSLSTPHTTQCLAFSPDGQLLALGQSIWQDSDDRDGTTLLWDLKTGTVPVRFIHSASTDEAGDAIKSYVDAVIFSRRGHHLFSGTDDDEVEQWAVPPL